VEGNPFFKLEEVPGAQKQPRYSTGLYHVAILLPTRRALAVKVRQFVELQISFGYSDHLVSEAFYLSDPDGNGLEIYRDRPRDEWQWQDGTVQMASDPIDLDSLFAELEGADLNTIALPTGTKPGHMHLRVGDIKLAHDFYHGVLGFDVTAQLPGALFLSAGGYHHHLGMNIWESRGAKPPFEPSVGLLNFSIVLSNVDELSRLVKRFEDLNVPFENRAGTIVVDDPWQNRILFEVRAL
jgi:catechol 2,3-dioxygenase